MVASRWQNCADLIGPGIEPQNYGTDSDVLRAGDRTVDLGGAKRLSGGEPKFEIKHKSRSLQKRKLFNWGAKHVDWGARPPLGAGPGCA